MDPDVIFKVSVNRPFEVNVVHSTTKGSAYGNTLVCSEDCVDAGLIANSLDAVCLTIAWNFSNTGVADPLHKGKNSDTDQIL